MDPARRSAPLPGTTGGDGPGPPSGSPRSLPKVLSVDEVRAILRAGAAASRRDGALLLWAYATACRVSELVRMEVGGLDPSRGRVRFWRPKRRDWHEVPVPPEAWEELFRYRPTLRFGTGFQTTGRDRWLFIGRKGHLAESTALRILYRAADAAGVRLGTAKGRAASRKGKGFHCFARHSRATHVLEAGGSVEAVRALLGHRSLDTSTTYLHVSTGWLEAQTGLPRLL